MGWEGLRPPYRTIVVDPPWDYPEGFVTGDHEGNTTQYELPYSALTVEEIAALPVAELRDDACRLFLWTTNRYLPSAFVIMRAWGFTYRQTIVWHKVDGNIGGSVAPNSAEFLLVGVHGAPAVRNRLKSNVLAHAHTRQHSRKPSMFLDYVELTSCPPYVELFCREPRFGWDSWGYGYELGQ